MRPDEFIICITLFLFSVVSSLLMAIFHARLPDRTGGVLLIVNIVLISVALILKFVSANPQGGFNYSFLFGICSGILSSGIYIRKKTWSVLKIYSLAHLLLVPAFLISPSKVVGFIGTASFFQYDPQKLRIADNYYLIEQIPITEVTSGNEMYKVIREMGMFHKTLERDIFIEQKNFTIDVIDYKPDSILVFRVITEDKRPDRDVITILLKPSALPKP